MSIRKSRFKLNFLLTIFSLGLACATTPTSRNDAHKVNQSQANAVKPDLNSAKTEHEHRPPHGGTLVVVGKEFAHVELVMDKSTGKLTAYALDGEAENAVKLTQPEIDIEISKPFNALVKLNAVENALTGEKKGDTSEFAGQAEQLKNLANFDAAIGQIFIKGQQFNLVLFNFPKGNEDQ